MQARKLGTWLGHVDTQEGAGKPKLNEVLYREPNPDGTRKMCQNCVLWLAKQNQCHIHDSDVYVPGDSVCGFHVFGIPMGIDLIPGGEASGKDPSEFDTGSLAAGTSHEMEHTTEGEVAQEIAMDHLAENPGYYGKSSPSRRNISPVDPEFSGLRRVAGGVSCDGCGNYSGYGATQGVCRAVRGFELEEETARVDALGFCTRWTERNG